MTTLDKTPSIPDPIVEALITYLRDVTHGRLTDLPRWIQ